MTYRRLGALIDHLPGESAIKTAVRDAMTPAELAQAAQEPHDGHGPWSHSDFLIAALYDRIGWVINAIYRAQGATPPDPKPMPRPGVIDPDARVYSAEQELGYLESLRRRHRELHGEGGESG